jgi:hypothetical protein
MANRRMVERRRPAAPERQMGEVAAVIAAADLRSAQRNPVHAGLVAHGGRGSTQSQGNRLDGNARLRQFPQLT